MTTRRRISAAAIAAALALLMVPLFAGIAKAVDTQQSGTLEVRVAPKMGLDEMYGIQIPVDAYQIATIDATSEDAQFEVVEVFEGTDGLPTEIYDRTTYDAEQKKAVNDALVQIIKDEGIAPFASGTVPAGGGRVALSASGSTNLPCGLYLVVPAMATDMKISDGLYEFEFMPYLVSLPTMTDGTVPDYAKDEVIELPGGLYESYDVTVNLKPGFSPRKGELNITKSLDVLNTSFGNPTFVFHVVATSSMTADRLGIVEGEVVYDNYVSANFTDTTQQTVTVTDIPAFTNITVTEIYSGSVYQVDGPSELTTSLSLTDLVANVSFKNKYDEHHSSGGSAIDNVFTYNDTDDVTTKGWTLEQKGLERG